MLRLSRIFANTAALSALVVGVLSVFAVVHVPAIAAALRLVPLTTNQWLLVGTLAVIPAVVGQGIKSAALARKERGQ